MDGTNIIFGGHPSWVDAAQLITAVISVAVAGWAVWYSNREARRNQTRTELTLSPAVVQIRNSNREQQVLGILIKNAGNGPAVIDKVFFIYRNIPIDIGTGKSWIAKLSEEMQTLYADDYKKLGRVPFGPSGINPGAVFAAGQEQWIVNAPRSKLSDSDLSLFQDFISNSTVIVFYHSVHKRRFNSFIAYDSDGNFDSSVSPDEWIKDWYKKH